GMPRSQDRNQQHIEQFVLSHNHLFYLRFYLCHLIVQNRYICPVFKRFIFIEVTHIIFALSLNSSIVSFSCLRSATSCCGDCRSCIISLMRKPVSACDTPDRSANSSIKPSS